MYRRHVVCIQSRKLTSFYMYPEVEHVQLLDTIIVQSSTCRLLRVELYTCIAYIDSVDSVKV